jgi:hypothetical protein
MLDDKGPVCPECGNVTPAGHALIRRGPVPLQCYGWLQCVDCLLDRPIYGQTARVLAFNFPVRFISAGEAAMLDLLTDPQYQPHAGMAKAWIETAAPKELV